MSELNVPTLIVGNFLSATLGTRSVCEDLAKQLARSGWPVVTASSRLGRVNRLVDMLSTVWRKRREYVVAQVDVYSGLAFRWAEAVCWSLRLAGKPYILSLHGGELPVFAGREPARVARLLRSAAAVTAPSRYLCDQMDRYGVKIALQPNPLDLSTFAFRLREEPRPRLAWLRAFHEIYNPSLAVKGLALLARSFPEVSLTMTGPDKGDGSMKQTEDAAAALNISGQVVLSGRIPSHEVPSRLNEADIFINTTNVDNTPVSVLEAMACGLCIVSTNVGGLSYLLEDGLDALLIPPGNPEALAGAVTRLLTQPGLARRLSSNARKKVEQFDWSVVLPQWEHLLLSVAGR